jgi:hypothetical protein
VRGCLIVSLILLPSNMNVDPGVDMVPGWGKRKRIKRYPGQYSPIGPHAPGFPCPPCPEPPPGRTESGHTHIGTYHGKKGCCHGTHSHKYLYDQVPGTCECFLKELDDECLSGFTPGLNCDGKPLK